MDFAAVLLEHLEEAGRGCAHHPPITRAPQTLDEATSYWRWFEKCPPVARHVHLRFVSDRCLYFFARYILKMAFLECRWGWDRCQEVQENP